jgi:hypothetical protein
MVVAASLPTPTILKLYACETKLEAVTVNGAPALEGMMFDGATEHVGGAPAPQLTATELP